MYINTQNVPLYDVGGVTQQESMNQHGIDTKLT